MMNVMIIYAHPNPESFNHAVLEQIKTGVADGKHTFKVIDLYTENFNPVLIYNEKVKRSGFLDRVFVSGFAYSNREKLTKGLLGDKSAWVIYTIDSPSWFVKWIRRSVEWRIMKDAVLKYCGIRRVKRMMFASVRSSSLKRRQKWLGYIYQQACYQLKLQ